MKIYFIPEAATCRVSMNLILFALRVFTQTGVLICTFYIHKNQVFTVLPYKWIAVRVVLCAGWVWVGWPQ